MDLPPQPPISTPCSTSLPPEIPPPQPSQPPPRPSQPPPPPPSTSLPSSSSSIPTPVSSSSNPNPSQNPNPKPPTTTLPHQSAQTPSQPRPPPSTFSRTLPQQQPHFSHFSSPLNSLPSSSASGSTGSPLPSVGSPSVSAAPSQRVGMAIGFPAPSQSPSSFSPSFGQHFGALGRTGVNAPEAPSNSNTSQVRPPMQGIGVLGSLGSNSQMRQPVIPAHHQQRPGQSSLRPPPASNNQPTNSKSFPGHGNMRPSSMGSTTSLLPNASQSPGPLNQPWLSSASQGKPSLTSPSYRQQMNPQTLQQRSHIPQPSQLTLPTTSQQQHVPSVQQQQQQHLPSNQSQDHVVQQVPPSRVPQNLPHQQQITRVQGTGNQKPSSLAATPPSMVQPGAQNKFVNAENEESCNRILSKRTIHELVNQVDPSEKLDPEVEDILVDIADDFVDSITRFGCLLAKHRKSTTLEAKDILLHLEKNWNMTLPGFGGDEIKSYRKQLMSDIHKERLAVIKKSIAIADAAHNKNSTGQAVNNAKGSLAKAPANIIGSPNFKNG